MQITVAGAQIPITLDIASNTEAILRAIDFAVANDARILLTPEGALSGYTHEFDFQQFTVALQKVVARARQAHLGMALGTAFMNRPGDPCYNQIRFYDTDGSFLGAHSKILRSGSLTEPPKGEIETYATGPLNIFRFQDVPVGGLICNDLWANPGCTPIPDSHLSQQLAGLGARIIFHAVNGGRDGSEWSNVAWNYHESNLRMRANAGQLWVVTVDNCHPLCWHCSAPSGVIDPKGNWVCRVEPVGTQYFVHSIELEDRDDPIKGAD